MPPAPGNVKIHAPTMLYATLHRTADSRFVVFQVLPTKAETDKAKKEKRKPEDMPKNALGIMDLSTGETARVERVIPIEPTATSSTHAAILTGATPDKTGIVSNQFHAPGTPRTLITKGLETEIAVATIADLAHRAGKRVAGIAFPFIDWISPRRSADFGISWSLPLTKPHVITLTRASWAAVSVNGLATAESPPVRAALLSVVPLDWCEQAAATSSAATATDNSALRRFARPVGVL